MGGLWVTTCDDDDDDDNVDNDEFWCVAGALVKQCDAQYGGDYYNYNEPVDYAYPDLSPKVGNQKNVGVYLLAPCFSIISSGAWLRLW